jgi:hypothetical protein
MGFTARDLAEHFNHQGVVEIFDNPPKVTAGRMSKAGSLKQSPSRSNFS